jgi:hypothetical protein
MLVSASPAALRFSADKYARRERDAERELRSLRSVFDLSSVFLEIGASDCALARRAAGFVDRVYAIDICEDTMGRLGGPPNLHRVVHDGVRIPLPYATVDIAFSRQLVISQLGGICHSLKDGGRFITFSKGPASELRKALLDAGFSAVRFYANGIRVPYLLARLLDDPFRLVAIK